jgi:hypothetical protein
MNGEVSAEQKNAGKKLSVKISHPVIQEGQIDEETEGQIQTLERGSKN